MENTRREATIIVIIIKALGFFTSCASHTLQYQGKNYMSLKSK